MGFWLLIILMMGVGLLVSGQLKNRMTEYSQIPLANGMSGADVAKRMLRDSGIYDVEVTSVEGTLTDNYNPAKKTVNLSPDVYNGRSVAAAAVAAHECGHAVQHAQAYSMLGLRSALVPVVSVSSNLVQWVLFGGVILFWAAHSPTLLIAGVVMLGLITLFSLVTLPVEFDASRRGLAWLDKSGIMDTVSHEKATNALWWAAMTYVVAAISSVATLLYYVSILNRRN